MFVDASAIIAIVAQESGWPSLSARLDQSERTYVSPIVVYESVVGLARARKLDLADARNEINIFIEELGAKLIPISTEVGQEAVEAFRRFGKGRHAASLNMGDCFAYACARSLEVPLLCKGNDFSKTDIELA